MAYLELGDTIGQPLVTVDNLLRYLVLVHEAFELAHFCPVLHLFRYHG